MTWSLSASGHAAVEQGEKWLDETKALEAEFVARLKEVLDDPKFGTITSLFNGHTTSGTVHTPTAATEAPAPVASDGPETSTTAPAADTGTSNA